MSPLQCFHYLNIARISLKIFSKFYANEYNPLLSTFHIQSLKKIGGYPLLDFFINAKIRQTRIFLKAEHFNSSISSGNLCQVQHRPTETVV